MNIRLLALLSFLPFLFISSIFAHTSDLCAPIAVKVPMKQYLKSKGHKAHFSNPVFYVELKNKVKAVLKFVDKNYKKASCAEVAAFRASQFLRINLVPPTIFYEMESQPATLQQYVEPCFDLMNKKNYEQALNVVSPEVLASMQLFYFVFGQWDPDPSNMIISKHNQQFLLHLIDN